MAAITGLSHLTNPLATPAQLHVSSSQLDGVPVDLEDSIRYEAAKFIQAAGILLRLPQDLVAEAIVIFTRFWIGSDGGSLIEYGAKDIAAASLYLVTKPSGHPISPRQLLSVFGYLIKVRPNIDTESLSKISAEDCFLSEASYHDARIVLVNAEAQILRILGFQTHVALPYALCINYLQTLDAFNIASDGQRLAKRAFAHLNSALLSPQLLYLTHQPPALAASAIYLSSKETGVKLPADEWWEVFDVDREELGFLVVALTSMAGFAEAEARTWSRRKVPMIVEDLQAELETKQMLEQGE